MVVTQTAQPGQPMKLTRGRNAQATRTDLLQAAMRRFTVLGYERTTMRDIAAHAGVNVSLINRYFGSKEGLFAAVMRESADAFEQLEVAEPTSSVDSILNKLSPQAWPEFGLEHPLLLLLGQGGDDQRVGDLRRRSLRAVTARLGREITADQPSDPTRTGLRAELILAMIAGVLSVRTALPDGSLASTDPDELSAILGKVTASIRNLTVE